MRKLIVFFFLVGVILEGAGQSDNSGDKPVDIISHQVKLGETVRMLSLKYLVTPAEIYYLNKFALTGIKAGMVLRIPVLKKETSMAATGPEASSEQISFEEQKTTEPIAQGRGSGVKVIDRTVVKNYTVKPHETLSSIAKKQNVSVDEIKLSNQKLLKGGLKSGMVLKIPGTRILAENESSIGGEETPKN